MYGMHSLIRIRPSWTMSTLAQMTTRSAAALVVLVMLMDSPQISIAQDDYPGPPPPPPVLTPASAPTQYLFSSPLPPVRPLTPPSSKNQTPSPTLSSPPSVLNPATPSAPQASPEKWNNSYPASDFRDDSVPPRFVLWPENLPYVKFVYFCHEVLVQPKRNLTDFSYKDSPTGSLQRLQTRPYFDLGLVDRHNTPYFRRLSIDWRVDIHRIVCPVVCEYTDIQRLYEYRLHRNVLLIGFAYGVVVVAILQLGVMVSIILLWVVNLDKVRCKVGKKGKTVDQSLIAFLWDWCKNLVLWLDFVPDWVHLVLLVMVGFSMMEAAGHSNFFEWRSMLFYNIGVTYTWLTLLAMVSSILFQCAQFLSSRKPDVLAQATDLHTEETSLLKKPSQNLSRKASTKIIGPLLEDSKASPREDSTASPREDSTASPLEDSTVSPLEDSKAAPVKDSTASPVKDSSSSPVISSNIDFRKSVKEFSSDDWKYQRIFGQTGVLILMSMYLLLVDDYGGNSMDSLASVIAGAIVVACIWSFAVATIVAIRSFFQGICSNISCTRSTKSSVSKSTRSSASKSSKSSVSLEPALEPAALELENC